MVKVFTDGAYSSLRKQGGWAFVFIKDGEKISSGFGTVYQSTNNRLEIMASLKAILKAKEDNIASFTLCSDSMYVIGTMSLNWKRKKNVDLWSKMDKAVEGLNIVWEHVKGHAGDKYNELCDTLAKHASQVNESEE